MHHADITHEFARRRYEELLEAARLERLAAVADAELDVVAHAITPEQAPPRLRLAVACPVGALALGAC